LEESRAAHENPQLPHTTLLYQFLTGTEFASSRIARTICAEGSACPLYICCDIVFPDLP
jgi:hypothetical protein